MLVVAMLEETNKFELYVYITVCYLCIWLNCEN